jgi:tRNA (mo5U34)-methyltransferase
MNRRLRQELERLGLKAWAGDPGQDPEVPPALHTRNRKARAFREALARLPDIRPGDMDLDRGRIRIGRPGELRPDDRRRLMEALRALVPWRKGPFDVFGIRVDSEWDASLKWERVRPHLEPLEGRRILDIGSSCGYYMFRMCSAAPRLLLGLEPYLTFYVQFQLLQHFIRADRVVTLPLRLEAFPPVPHGFDTVFVMGILYHQRDPGDVLNRIRRVLVPGGQLVLETLVLDRTEDAVLEPPGRYAKMNNVYAIPSVTRLTRWLRNAGYDGIRCVDVTPTTLAEQRPTNWINSESLDAFLDPHRPHMTVEGHPAPVRAVILAHA